MYWIVHSVCEIDITYCSLYGLTYMNKEIMAMIAMPIMIIIIASGSLLSIANSRSQTNNNNNNNTDGNSGGTTNIYIKR